jgi:hypothetical protein
MNTDERTRISLIFTSVVSPECVYSASFLQPFSSRGGEGVGPGSLCKVVFVTAHYPDLKKIKFVVIREIRVSYPCESVFIRG